MSQAEYARHRGVTRQAVSKAVKNKSIPVGKDGRINPADADYALDGNRARLNMPADEPGPSPAGGFSDSSGLTKARTANEVYKARLSQLEYEEKTGRLRPVADVVAAAQLCAEQVVRVFDRLPQRAEEIAAAARTGDAAAVRALLKTIVRELKRVATDEFAKLATGGPADDGVEAVAPSASH